MIITIQDVRAAKMCSRGARRFFERHSLDWRTFISDGLPEEVIAATNDAMAKQVIEVARVRRRR